MCGAARSLGGPTRHNVAVACTLTKTRRLVLRLPEAVQVVAATKSHPDLLLVSTALKYQIPFGI